MSRTGIIEIMRTDQQTIEIFHLLFLNSLEKKIEKKFFALKGGCNLRFFFKSIRYSEDIDIDVTVIAKDTLRKNINNLLNSTPFQKILFSQGIEIENISEPKQTETTQRWKFLIRNTTSSRNLPTKIEFSRRNMQEGIVFEAVDNEIIQQYRLQPILCNHYIKESAFIQKISALIHRTETQARDVFDLKILLDMNINFSNIQFDFKDPISIAIENAISIGYPEYKSQVVSYLLPQYQEYYGTVKIWNDIQTKVMSALEKLTKCD